MPVYVHVMAGKRGEGDVSDSQITQQIAVLNKTFAGSESSAAANTGFSFTLAGTDRYFNDTWHRDGSSSKYRKETRLGGKNALNIWLVDFNYLGIATFPWDYARNPGIDGIRVQYSSLPGGSATNYNLGETATHEAGHWFGLYHTFQGGCTATNDEVADTPAQSSATSGCPDGPRLVQPPRPRPDPQLHGLQLRHLLRPSSPAASRPARPRCGRPTAPERGGSARDERAPGTPWPSLHVSALQDCDGSPRCPRRLDLLQTSAQRDPQTGPPGPLAGPSQATVIRKLVAPGSISGVPRRTSSRTTARTPRGRL